MGRVTNELSGAPPADDRGAGSAATLAASAVKAAAHATGFALCGLARARSLEGTTHAHALDRWLSEGHAGALRDRYMGARRDERLDPGRILPGARTVVALAIPYHRPAGERLPVARYARGGDYHNLHRTRLKKLRRRLLVLDATLETYACVDTGPVLEKVWAQEAGLGFIGKNGCLIHPVLGSWFTLSVLLLDRAVDVYDEPLSSQCGDCELCLRACPTGAFAAPGVVDARRCIAYLTIENPDPVPEPLRAALRGRLFGCDVCQEVCPFNRAIRSPPEVPAAFAPRALARMAPEEVLTLPASEYARTASGTPLARPGHAGLRRNAALLLGAQRKRVALPVLRAAACDPEPLVAEAAAWAVRRIAGDP